ncbi:putative lipoprotein [Macrolepiota fuliginosa MF-IS2]|uniref:Lipoprotein n=1 Tax=Macrolepiota fuliginosa MF-IS2 TaxID=1400762 RepID=A0A9P5XMS5_9AGAR|nr:putative lipoprotein [Macrolepiota fuliginosa MF-IS2]
MLHLLQFLFLCLELSWIVHQCDAGHPTKPAQYQQLPSLREQASIEQAWRAERIAGIPALLRKYNVDAWLMIQREHAEDTIWWSIKNATAFDSHRRTVVLFHTNSSTTTGLSNPIVWVDNTDQVWPELRSTFEEHDFSRIVLNTDRNIAFAGGLHVGEYETLAEELGEMWMKRTVNEPMLAIEYVATRLDGYLPYYRKMQETVWAMLEEGFSHRVVRPGITSTEDLSWWFREKIQERNLTTWNQPRISVLVEDSYPGWEGTDDVIQEGDILHIDFGITAMGLNTDTQHMAYVLRTDQDLPEASAPQSLKDGLKKANRMQDIVLSNMKPGVTGNQVLQQSLDQMRSEGIEGQIFCHPIGDWGHDAGAVIGFLNLPEYVPVVGELPLFPNTYYSIELYAYHFVEERNETIRFRIEENAHWNKDTQSWQFVRGRQEKYHLIDKRKTFAGSLLVQSP